MSTTETETPVIETRGLTRRFRSFDAVSGLDLSIGKGRVCAFLIENSSDLIVIV